MLGGYSGAALYMRLIADLIVFVILPLLGFIAFRRRAHMPIFTHSALLMRIVLA